MGRHEDHKRRHIELHKMLDELVANFIASTGKLPSATPIMELMTWSHMQTMCPDTLNKDEENEDQHS